MELFFLYWMPVVVLVIASITDWKTKTIPNTLTLGAIVIIAVFRIFQGEIFPYIFGTLFVLLGLWLVKIISKSQIGGGDIKLYVYLALVTGFPLISWIIFLSFLLSIFYMWMEKVKSMIMAPNILIAYLTVMVLYFRITAFSLDLA